MIEGDRTDGFAPTSNRPVPDETIAAGQALTSQLMDFDLIRSFVADAKRACRDCNQGLALTGATPELVRLLHAARSAAIERRGKVAIPDRCVYEYHVHGAGYTFEELPAGKIIGFDVVPVEGVHRIRFSASSVLRYASSVGLVATPESVQSDLDRLSEENSCLVHNIDGMFNNFYWVGE